MIISTTFYVERRQPLGQMSDKVHRSLSEDSTLRLLSRLSLPHKSLQQLCKHEITQICDLECANTNQTGDKNDVISQPCHGKFNRESRSLDLKTLTVKMDTNLIITLTIIPDVPATLPNIT